MNIVIDIIYLKQVYDTKSSHFVIQINRIARMFGKDGLFENNIQVIKTNLKDNIYVTNEQRI